MQEKTPQTEMRATRGKGGERLAESYLRERGFRIVARNYRIPGGEIDLIALKDGFLHFLEVKTRGRGSLIPPLEALTPAQMRRIRRTAQHYLVRNPSMERHSCHFGVVGIDWSHHPPRIECLLDAFV